MKQVIIYQIGRLDVNALDKLKFCIGEHKSETCLSSFAIREHMERNNHKADVILFYPVSLPFNAVLINEGFRSQCADECYILLNNVFNSPADYLKDPLQFFRIHPHSKEAKGFIAIHSLGEYRTSNGLFSFDCHYPDIVIMMLVDMIKRYLVDAQKIVKVLADISSGHNIYVSALIEALRYFGVWLKLYNWGKDSPALEIAFSEPVTGGKEAEYKIHFEKQPVKAFFSSPVKNEDIEDYKLARAIFPHIVQRDMKRRTQEILEKFLLVFSAIKNNTPLAIYHFGYQEVEEISQILNELINHIERKLTEKYDVSPNLNKDDYIKALLACGFYLGISRILKEKGISKADINGVDIRTMRECFKEINDLFVLNLNEVVLGNEIDKIEKDIKSDADWTLLVDLFYPKDKKATTPQKRNFFAHAGFEGNVTECKRQNDRLYLRYNQKHLKNIQKWLRESV